MSEARTQAPAPAAALHDAFISYSRRDKAFAAKLGAALRGYRPPKGLGLAARSLDIFRDEEDFTGVEYHQAVRTHLRDSARLVLVCSPHSRRSEYVAGEIRLFAEVRGADNIVPVLLAGIPNNEAQAGQEDRMAFPDALCEALEMPLAIDYRGFDPSKDKPDRGSFRAQWYSLLANLHGISRNEIEQREKKRDARRRRITQGIVGAIMGILLAATVVSLYFWRQAVDQRRAAVARQLAAQAELTRNQGPSLVERSTLLAVESMKHEPTLEADLVLRPLLASLPRPANQFSLGGEAFEVVFSPDRRHVAAATARGVTVWELATARRTASLPALVPATELAFSPDGGYLATGSGSADPSQPRNYVAQIWQVRDGREVARLAHAGPVSLLAFSADGRWLATAAEKHVGVWEVSTGKEVAPFPHERTVLDIALSPDGERLFTETNAEVNRIWSVRTREPIAGAQLEPGMFNIAFSPDWQRVATAGEDGITVRDAATNELLLRIPERGASHPAFLAGGAWLVATARGARIVWDAQTADELARLDSVDDLAEHAISPDRAFLATLHAGHVTAIRTISGEEVTRVFHPDVHLLSAAFSADGGHLATVSVSGRVRLWETTAGREAPGLRHDEAVLSVDYSPDGRYLVTNSHDRSARVWEIRSGRQVTRIDSDYGVRRVVVSPGDGKYLAVAIERVTRLVETLTGRTVAILDMTEGVEWCEFSADGKHLATFGLDDVTRMWEVPSGREIEIAHPPLGDGIASLAFSPDAKHLAATTINSSLAVVWDRATGREVARLDMEAELGTLTFSPDGRYIAALSVERGEVVLWDALSGRQMGRIAHEGLVSFAFGPDGRLLATVGSEGPEGRRLAAAGIGTGVRVWSMPTGKAVSRLPHDGTVTGLVFSKDGARLMTGSTDGAARVWDPLTGREVARLQARSPVLAIAASPDGKYLATGSDDGIVRTWFLRPVDLIAEACSRVTRNLTREEWSQFLPDEPYAATCPNLPGDGTEIPAASPR